MQYHLALFQYFCHEQKIKHSGDNLTVDNVYVNTL